VDGRSDFYGAKFGRKFLEVMDGKYDWKGTLDRYGIEAVLLPVDASLASTLKESREMAPRIRRWGGHPVPEYGCWGGGPCGATGERAVFRRWRRRNPGDRQIANHK